MNSQETPAVKLRPEIVALAAYKQGKPAPADAFKLSSNENPFEPIPAVLEAIAAAGDVNRYPEASGLAVREQIAARFGVAAERVHLGAGSVALLAQLIQAAATVGDEVVYAWRSFEAYPGLVAVSGASSVQVPVLSDGRHDLPAMLRAVTDRTRVVIVCSPNNPTGSIVTADEFGEFMNGIPANILVILDEAYVEFVTDESSVDGRSFADRYPNVVILRTFSKAYGLAGLRLGYAVGAEHILDAARSTAIPLSVTEQAKAAGLASLVHEDLLLERVARLAVQRDRVWQALVDQGWDVPRPHGNFVWLATGDSTEYAAGVFESHGIVVRALLPDGVRVTIGEAASVDKLLRASAEVVRNLPSPHSGPALD
ncbi:histidinol-phosphate transaminase [Lacisediminihabitans sp.]|uniref:histidinol-phosphate transaminase n=1 Tax=Lacisediminihabitans sp. TaxID=2787631 RepID=UPI002F928EE1